MTTTQQPQSAPQSEVDTLLAVLAERRYFLTYTAQKLSDEQARDASTVSTLTVGGLIKHVAQMEEQWAQFMLDGAAALPDYGVFSDYASIPPEVLKTFSDGFTLLPDETLAGVIEDYQRVAARTEEIARSLPDLGIEHALPPAPWFEPGARWSGRRVLTHLIGETAQHSGHADIIRETIDGQKSMG